MQSRQSISHTDAPAGRASAGILRFLGEIWVPLLVFLVPILCYWPVVNSGFVSDDFLYHQFFKNTPADIIAKLQLQRQGVIELEYFRPSVIVGYWIDYGIWSDNPFGFHLSNLLHHGLNAVLLFWLARLLGMNRFGAAVGALAYSLYPSNSEAVSWISGRADLMAFTYMVLSLVLWCIARIRADVRWMIASGAAFFIAVLAKENAAAGALVLPILDWILHMRMRSERGKGVGWYWKGYVAFVIIVAAYIAFRYWLFGDIGGHRGLDNRSAYFDFDAETLWSNAVLFDLRIFVTPVNRLLWPDWPNVWRIALIAGGVMTGLALFAGLVFAAIRIKREKLPLLMIVLGILWVILMLLPIAPLPPATDSLIRTRFLYTSSAGLALWIGATAWLGWRGGRILQVVTAVLLVGFLVLSGYTVRQYNQVWLESGEIAGEIHSVMAENTSHLMDGASLFVVNFPRHHKGVPCAPYRYGDYLEFLYGYRNVWTCRTVMREIEVMRWWENLRATYRRPAAGFVWIKSTEELIVLPPIDRELIQSRPVPETIEPEIPPMLLEGIPGQQTDIAH